MPIATSSRRIRSNKEPSSDIEEDKPTQQGNTDEVDEDDEDLQPRRSIKSVKREKLTKKQRQARNDEEDGDDEDEDDCIDIGNFNDQPLGNGDEVKLKGMAADWANMRKVIGQNSFPMMRDVAVSMADAADGEEGENVSPEVVMPSSVLTQGSRVSQNLTLLSKI
jgi:hypothetical protein